VGGSYYTQLCGPRPAAGFECTAQSPTLALFAATYQKHRDVDGWRAERVMDRMLESMGGDQAEGASQDGEHMTAIKNAWLERAELGLDEDDWNAPFVRQVCRVMRCNHPQIDPGDLYANDHEPDTAAYHASRAVYEFCLQGEALPTCKSPVLSDFTINSYELGICLKSQPDCIREREVCLGTCGGSETGAPMVHDVVTTMVKDDLYGVDATRLDNGRINATLQTVIVNVPLFDISPSFRLFSARVRTRGGFTAIDPAYCAQNPLACAVVQKGARPCHTPARDAAVRSLVLLLPQFWSARPLSFLSSVKDSATGTRPPCRRRRRRRRHRSSTTASPSCRRRCRRRRRRRRLGTRAVSNVSRP